jgi:hypothetical protein
MKTFPRETLSSVVAADNSAATDALPAAATLKMP